MPKLGTTSLSGESGESYDFNVYTGNMRFNDFIPGVFVIAKKGAEPILIDESGNVDIAIQKHDKRDTFESHGVDEILLLRNASEEKRQAIAKDLIAAFAPPCN